MMRRRGSCCGIVSISCVCGTILGGIKFGVPVWMSYTLVQPALNLLRTIGTLRNECVIEHNGTSSHAPVGSLAGIFIKWGTPYLKMVRTEHTPIPWGTSLLGNISRFLFTNLLFPICIDMEVGVSHRSRSCIRRAGVKWSHRSAIWIPPVLPDMYRRRLDDPYKAEPTDGQYVIGSVGSLRKIKGI